MCERGRGRLASSHLSMGKSLWCLSWEQTEMGVLLLLLKPRGSSNQGGASHRHLRPEAGLKASHLFRAPLLGSLTGEAWERSLEDNAAGSPPGCSSVVMWPLLGLPVQGPWRPGLEWDLTALSSGLRKAEGGGHLIHKELTAWGRGQDSVGRGEGRSRGEGPGAAAESGIRDSA